MLLNNGASDWQSCQRHARIFPPQAFKSASFEVQLGGATAELESWSVCSKCGAVPEAVGNVFFTVWLNAACEVMWYQASVLTESENIWVACLATENWFSMMLVGHVHLETSDLIHRLGDMSSCQAGHKLRATSMPGMQLSQPWKHQITKVPWLAPQLLSTEGSKAEHRCNRRGGVLVTRFHGSSTNFDASKFGCHREPVGECQEIQGMASLLRTHCVFGDQAQEDGPVDLQTQDEATYATCSAWIKEQVPPVQKNYIYMI